MQFAHFLIGCAVRYIRGYDEGNTMLVHLSRFVKVSEKVGAQISNYLRSLKSTLIGNETEFSLIKKIWNENYLEKLNNENNIPDTIVDYENVEKIIKELLDLNKFHIGLMNGSADSKADYDRKLRAQGNIITIGGQRLSRGLTLKSLITSYFLRSAQSPLTDTMTQMGRWFGYRLGYEDICKLFLPTDLEVHFREFAETEMNLRKRIEDMGDKGKTLEHYVMMLERHPGWRITSSARLRKTRTIRLDYNNYHGQTVVLHKSKENTHNIGSVEELLSKLGKNTTGRKKGNHYLWRNVESKKIIDFIHSYKTHPDNTTFISEPMAQYIKNMNKEFNEITLWSVGLISGSGEKGFIKKHPVNFVLRSSNQKPNKQDDMTHRFQSLTSADDEAF